MFVSGFNHYLGIDDEFDDVNCTMYTNKIAEFKNLCKERICFYSTNDPYVKFDALQSFEQDITATQNNVSKTAGHFNKAAGYTKFEELLKY